MLAKAGEGDRVIKTKMVRSTRCVTETHRTDYFAHSQNICLRASEKVARRTDVNVREVYILFVVSFIIQSRLACAYENGPDDFQITTSSRILPLLSFVFDILDSESCPLAVASQMATPATHFLRKRV